MEQDKIKQLIDKYFDGETTLAEEQHIAHYLNSHDDLSDEWRALKVMLCAMTDMRFEQSPVEPIKPAKPRAAISMRLWLGGIGGAVAAAIIVGIVIFGKSSDAELAPQPSDAGIICYKDGVRVDDSLVARAEVDEILGGVAGDLQFAMECINNVNILPTASR